MAQVTRSWSDDGFLRLSDPCNGQKKHTKMSEGQQTTWTTQNWCRRRNSYGLDNAREVKWSDTHVIIFNSANNLTNKRQRVVGKIERTRTFSKDVSSVGRGGGGLRSESRLPYSLKNNNKAHDGSPICRTRADDILSTVPTSPKIDE